jgi:anti-sigma-K factor RskA
MSSTNNTDRELLAVEHVFGLTEAEDLEEVSRLLATDPAFAKQVAQLQTVFAELDETAPMTPPPPQLWTRITDQLGREPAPAEKLAVRSASRDRRFAAAGSFWKWTTAASAFAALVLFAVLMVRPLERPVLIAVLSGEGGRPGAVVETFADGRVRLIPLQAFEVPKGRALQVWTLRDRAEGPVSVGLIDQARTLKLDLGKLPRPNPDQLFEITLEPETGSPTGRPTGPILAKGLAAPTL